MYKPVVGYNQEFPWMEDTVSNYWEKKTPSIKLCNVNPVIVMPEQNDMQILISSLPFILVHNLVFSDIVNIKIN